MSTADEQIPPLTADITDEQINALRRSEVYGDRSPIILQATTNALSPDGGVVGPDGHHARRETQAEARARCAEIISARAVCSCPPMWPVEFTGRHHPKCPLRNGAV